MITSKITQYLPIKCLSSRYYSKSTIFALSSGQGKCGVAVIRVTGPESKNALKSIASFSELPQPRQAYLRNLRNFVTGEIIDNGLVLWFPGPRSFTGEDSCEFQVHGGAAVINGILTSLSQIPSFRIAEPGEFTKRAFYNEKLNLTEVEGLSDLLNAETEVQRKQAFLQSQGSLNTLYNQWREDLNQCLAHLEAVIDFDETESLDADQEKHISQLVQHLTQKIEIHLINGRKGEILRCGAKAVILGKPNVGKSSLLNLLCGREAAIVTPISGTTRDVLEVRLDIQGYPLVLVDTAGLRKDSSDIIECEGMKRAISQVNEADLVIVLTDAPSIVRWQDQNKIPSSDCYIKTYLESLGLTNDILNAKGLIEKPSIYISNKCDLHRFEDEKELIQISCKSGDGYEELINRMCLKLAQICGNPTKEHPAMNNARHFLHVHDCLKELHIFISKTSSGNWDDSDIVILAEHLRRASKHLGKLVGTTTTDELLNIIFRDFCIGK